VLGEVFLEDGMRDGTVRTCGGRPSRLKDGGGGRRLGVRGVSNGSLAPVRVEDEMGDKGERVREMMKGANTMRSGRRTMLAIARAGASVNEGGMVSNANHECQPDMGGTLERGAGRQQLSGLINELGRVGRLKQRGVAAGVCGLGSGTKGYTARKGEHGNRRIGDGISQNIQRHGAT
jgi:hypothetical protein